MWHVDLSELSHIGVGEKFHNQTRGSENMHGYSMVPICKVHAKIELARHDQIVRMKMPIYAEMYIYIYIYIYRERERELSCNNVMREKHPEIKNDVFWAVTPCGSCINRRFETMYRLCHQCDSRRARNNISTLRNNFCILGLLSEISYKIS
jgi:hypothetical protein